MAERPRIAILDDDAIFTALVTAALSSDFDFLVGRNGHHGLDLCRAHQVDLVITDIGMPLLDGIEMIKQFDEDPKLSSIPILVCTATHFTRRSRDEVMRYRQVREVLLKPANLDLIMAAIRKALSKTEGEPKKPLP